ncbi:hypothetical protein DUNSADRAFT_8373 [Dunaliella salina]|uniref:PPIase cyclophilin-type domain-containing protein n=1 Tax=Dunaliella salina TaxID=3046 RepID=A0ABQ7GJV7_DUNSA|nr:hypothetical protein DUNSADRAFT_8373 [Dunaliella salina]|eukprot:KAF5834833.1 hypothetical protein DUNSADRAFT_8373 [Dunaliella salina]
MMLLHGDKGLACMQARKTSSSSIAPASGKTWKQITLYKSKACPLRQLTASCNKAEMVCTAQTAPKQTKRELLQAALSLPLLTAAPQSAKAEGDKAFLDVNLEGRPLGRIVIQLFSDVSTGASRFRHCAMGKEGVHYQLSRFDGIFPTHIRCNGVRSLSYSANAESPIAGGDNLETLEAELNGQQRHHDQPGLVSLIVKEAQERPIKERLVAKKGQLVTVAEQAGEAPNATGFTILRSADQALDATNLIVGRVVAGMDVVETIAAQPYAKPRDSIYDGPFFNAAKAIGDKRATTAEKGFNRPLKRIIVANSGLA